MENSSPRKQEIVADQPIEDIPQLEQISLGEGAATCQVCESSFQEDDPVGVYVFRPAGEVMFQVGWVVCADENHELLKEFTLGVRELIVEGCVGCNTDEEVVLVELVVVGVSATATKSVRLLPDGTDSEADASGEPDDAVDSRLFGGEKQ